MHIPAAVRNGVIIKELEEIIYYAPGCRLSRGSECEKCCD
jgi:hypothetical protein